jgi:hypothetical protein
MSLLSKLIAYKGPIKKLLKLVTYEGGEFKDPDGNQVTPVGTQGNTAGLRYAFSTTTDVADPGQGIIRLNNATQASATAMYIDNLDSNGTDMSAFIDSWVSGSKLIIRANDNLDASVLIFTIGTLTNSGGYRTVVLSSGTGSSFADAEQIAIQYYVSGANGSNGSNGTNGTNGTDGADGVDGVDGKTIVYGTVDPTTEGVDGDTYIKSVDNAPSVIYGPKAAGVWPAGISVVGTNGTNGDQGYKAGLRMTFNSGTDTTDPGAGKFKFDSATLASITTLRIDDVDLLSTDLQTLYASWAIGDLIHVKSASNTDSTTITVRINGTPAEGVGFWSIPVEGVHGAIPSNAEVCAIQHAPGPGIDPGVQSVATFTSLPDATTLTGETYLVLDKLLHYTSDGTYWLPQNRKFLYDKQTSIVKYIAPAATFITLTPSTAAAGANTLLTSAGVHGLTGAIAVGAKVCVKTGNGTVAAESFHTITAIAADTTGTTIQVGTPFASFGAGAVTLYVANEQVVLRTVPIHALTPTSSLEIFSSWEFTQSTNAKWTYVLLETTEFSAVNTASGTSDGVATRTFITNMGAIDVQKGAVVASNSTGTGTSSEVPASGEVDTSSATTLKFACKPAVANEYIAQNFCQTEMSA